jgi:hypothetical protein
VLISKTTTDLTMVQISKGGTMEAIQAVVVIKIAYVPMDMV